jgi:hypothetical protein
MEAAMGVLQAQFHVDGCEMWKCAHLHGQQLAMCSAVQDADVGLLLECVHRLVPVSTGAQGYVQPCTC